MEVFGKIFIILIFVLVSCKGSEKLFNEMVNSDLPLTDSLSPNDFKDNISSAKVIDSVTPEKDKLTQDPSTEFDSTYKPLPPLQHCVSPLTSFELIICMDPWINPGPWICPGPFVNIEKDEPKTSITLDFELPTNELEAILSPALFEIESFPSSTSTGKESLVISVYKDLNLNIILRDQNSEELKIIHSGFLEVDRHSFEIDLSASDEGYFFVCLESESDQKILSIRRDNPVF